MSGSSMFGMENAMFRWVERKSMEGRARCARFACGLVSFRVLRFMN